MRSSKVDEKYKIFFQRMNFELMEAIKAVRQDDAIQTWPAAGVAFL